MKGKGAKTLVRKAHLLHAAICARPFSVPRAFTLIELLVVVAIIATLAALILPALSRAKAVGLRVKCLSNLHQIGLGLRMYLDDFHQYPVYGNAAGGMASSIRANYWL